MFTEKLLRFLRPCVVVMLVASLSPALRAQTGNYTFTNIDFPGAPAGSTVPTAINDADQVTGYYTDASGISHGFLYSGGDYTSFDAPGDNTNGTFPWGINNAGVISGFFTDDNGSHGFVMNNGVFTQFDFGIPGVTTIFGINNEGDVVGTYAESTGPQGFILNYVSNQLTNIGCTGLAAVSPAKINDTNQIAAFGSTGGPAYFYNAGVCTPISDPGQQTTEATGINNSGLVAGYAYNNPNNGGVSFLWVSQTQQYIPINYSSDISVLGLNNNADITGDYAVNGVGHGFIGTPQGQQSYTLTVSVTGPGTVSSSDGNINCPPNCSYSYPSGTPVTLSATPSQGDVFVTWTGACSGGGSCSVTMNQNQTVGAIFSGPLQFVSVTPCRVVDTRKANGPFGGPTLQGNTSRSFAIPQGPCGIPSSAAAYSLNVTIVPHEPLNYLTIWPTGENQPTISTMNSPDGRTKANAAIVPAGTMGAVTVYVTDTTDVILDIDGYFTAPSSQTLEFYPLTPCRVVDTREQNGPLGGPYLQNQVQRSFPVPSSDCQIPANAAAYSMNFTVVPYNGEPLGYLTVWPQGGQMPIVSTLNNPTATIVANAAIVPAGTGGGITVYPYGGDTQLIIDINGYFAEPGTGLSLYPAAPCRVLDTRSGNGAFSGELTVNVVGSPCNPPSAAQAYVFNATVVPVGSLGYLTLWPDSEQQPVVSTLNATDGKITSNMAIVPNIDGKTDAFAYGTTQLILDLNSYFAP